MIRGQLEVALLVALAALSGCGESAERNYAETQSGSSSAASQDLDALAVETGALPNAEQTDPAGRYGQRYEGGSDSFCLIPDESGSGRYRFGAETRIGSEEYCRGSGHAKLAADKLLLNFEGEGAKCVIVARYEGDKIVMPGGLDIQCSALCSSRGSFSGVTFPRLDRDAAAAKGMQGANRQPLCR